jgi:hypothetical protein
MNVWRCERGETTLSNVFFAFIFVICLMSLVSFGLYFYTAFEIVQTKARAERAMTIHGGYTTEVTDIIEENLGSILNLSNLTVTATPYPVNRGDKFSIMLEYHFPLGLASFSQDLDWTVTTVPIRSRAVATSEKVIR